MSIHEPPPSEFSAEAFRSLMRSPASSVVVVATGTGSARSGCTVTAICSLSDSPPSVLVCLNRRSSALTAIRENSRFSVNYLAEDQTDVADTFAGRRGLQGAQRFGGLWEQTGYGLPRLRGALAFLECDLVSATLYGSHEILIGRVLAGAAREANPLLYAAGNYQILDAG